MSRYLYRVHVEGVWHRPADGAEWGHHQLIRNAARREGFSAEFVMRRDKLPGGVRYGTFEANGIFVYAEDAQKAVTRAQKYLTEFISDLTCTAPKLLFDRDAARTRWAKYVEKQEARVAW